MRAHHLAQAGEMGVVAFAAEQGAAQLVLETLDGARQRGCETLQLSAARVKFKLSQTARK
jgi:hypothetical protein